MSYKPAHSICFGPLLKKVARPCFKQPPWNSEAVTCPYIKISRVLQHDAMWTADASKKLAASTFRAVPDGYKSLSAVLKDCSTLHYTSLCKGCSTLFLDYPEDGGKKHLKNNGNYLLVYTQPLSAPLWYPCISMHVPRHSDFTTSPLLYRTRKSMHFTAQVFFDQE